MKLFATILYLSFLLLILSSNNVYAIDCSRPSTYNGCEHVSFTNTSATCDTPDQGVVVNRSTNCSLPPLTNPPGNNDRCSTCSIPPGNQNGWQLTFSDEFNGTTLDHKKWGVTYRTGNRTNNPDRELEWYIDNAHIVSDGTLKLIAKYETAQSGLPYTSGMISSKVDSNSPYLVNFYASYGYFESRMKVPSKPGTWPTFWLLPAPGGWPPEIDIMEMHMASPRTNGMTSHINCNYPLSTPVCWSQAIGAPFVLPPSEGKFSDAFHVFSVDWQPGLIVWYIDGVERFRTRVYQKETFQCNRCSVMNGCERTEFRSSASDCAVPIPGSGVTRTTDSSCQPINGGDNSRCTTPIPGLPAQAGDLNSDGHVNIYDYNELVSKFGNPYTILDYNDLVANFGK